MREGPWVPDRHDPRMSPYNAVLGTATRRGAGVMTERDAAGVRAQVRLERRTKARQAWCTAGCSALVMDQLFGEAAVVAGVGGMTVRLEIRYSAPTPVHQDLSFEAHVEQSDDRLVRLVGSVSCAGATTVTASATFFRLTEEQAHRLFPHLVGP